MAFEDLDPYPSEATLASEPQSVRDMITWFLTRYEDPTENCPHDSREGGFQYIFGGPYDAHEELCDHFAGAEDHQLERAADILNRITDRWSGKPDKEVV